MGQLTDISIDFFDHALFCRLVDEYFGSDAEYARFTIWLRENPAKGDVVENAGGARKVRYPDVPRKKGARSGLRVIYFYFAEYHSITCVAVYRKSDKSDLTADEKRVLRVLSDELAAADARRKGRAWMAKRPVSVMEQLESALQDVRAGRRRHVAVEPPPVPAYSASEVRGIRDALNMSQTEFAELLDVSPRSVQAWEQGIRAPGRGVCYLLEHYSSPDWIEKLRFPEPPARRPGGAGGSARRGRTKVVAGAKLPQSQVLVVKATPTRKSDAPRKRAKGTSTGVKPATRGKATAKTRQRQDH